MAEQLICNQQVDGSTPFTSSNLATIFGGIPERPKGADCKSVVTDFAGPNPASPTKNKKPTLESVFLFLSRETFSDSLLVMTRNWFVLFRASRCQLASKRRKKKPRKARIQSFPKVKLFAFIWTPNRCPFLCFSKNLRKISKNYRKTIDNL